MITLANFLSSFLCNSELQQLKFWFVWFNKIYENFENEGIWMLKKVKFHNFSKKLVKTYILIEELFKINS
jgi:hypothetical protein